MKTATLNRSDCLTCETAALGADVSGNIPGPTNKKLHLFSGLVPRENIASFLSYHSSSSEGADRDVHMSVFVSDQCLPI